MKRLLSVLFVTTLLITLCVTASAESAKLSLNYVPRSQRGSLFYLDVYCSDPVSAAVFELSYDPTIAEFRDAYCDDDNADAMGNAVGNTVKIAYSHRAGVSGKLYRLSFKALHTGSTRFTLHITQAVDGDLNDMTNIGGCTAEVKFGKDDVVSSDTIKQKSSEKASGKASKSSEKSSKSTKSYSGSESDLTEDDEGDTAIEPAEENKVDFSGENNKLWFVLGCATALFVVLAAGGGFILGKKLQKKPRPAADDPESADKNDPDGAVNDEPDSVDDSDPVSAESGDPDSTGNGAAPPESDSKDPFDKLDNSV